MIYTAAATSLSVVLLLLLLLLFNHVSEVACLLFLRRDALWIASVHLVLICLAVSRAIHVCYVIFLYDPGV